MAPLLSPDIQPVYMTDMFLILAGWIAANVIFNNFEKHLSWKRRLFKLCVVLLVFYAVGVVAGKPGFYGLLLALTIGQIILHAWYFPRNGINGLTAEPRDRYLALITRMKSGRN